MHVRQHHPRHGGRPRVLRSRDCTYCDRDDGGQLHAPHHDDGGQLHALHSDRDDGGQLHALHSDRDDGGQLHALHSDRDDGGKPSRAPVPGLAVRFASLASLARLQCLRRPGSRSTLALPVRRGPRPHLPFPSRRHESRRSLVAPFHRSGAVGGRKRGSRPRARTRGGVGIPSERVPERTEGRATAVAVPSWWTREGRGRSVPPGRRKHRRSEYRERRGAWSEGAKLPRHLGKRFAPSGDSESRRAERSRASLAVGTKEAGAVEGFACGRRETDAEQWRPLESTAAGGAMSR